MNLLAKIDGKVAFRLREARDKRDRFFKEGKTDEWIYWKGKVEAYKSMRKITMSPFKKESGQ